MVSRAIQDSDVLEGLSVRYLKVFGLWGAINDYRKTGKRNRFINAKFFLTFLFASPYIFCQFASYFYIDIDINKLIFLNLHLFPAAQMCCKLFVFYFRIDSQCRLFNLLKMDFLIIPEEIRTGAADIFKKISRGTNMFCVASFIVNASYILTNVADPSISVDYILYHTGDMALVTTGRKKIWGGWYPVPMAETPYYEIIYFYEAIVGGWAGILLAVYVCVFYQVLMCLYAQFTILNFKVSSLAIKPLNCKTNKKLNSMSKELYEILKEHEKLLRYAKELRSVYNPLVTLVLGTGIFVLIIAIFQFLFGHTEDPMFVIKSLIFLGYQFIEVSMFCFGSSSVEKASSDLYFAVYSSEWYKADKKFRRDAQMMMIRARQGETLTAIGMYPVNVETIMSILHFTYTVSAVMARMAE